MIISTQTILPCTCGEKPKYTPVFGLLGCVMCDKYVNAFVIDENKVVKDETDQIKLWNDAIIEETMRIIEGECEDVTNKRALPELKDE